MSLQTELLGLFQYEESDGTSTFNLDKALNENWDKIDDYLKGVLLSDLSNADDATLQAAVKAIVLSMVANNLTTTAANLLLDARQGKALGDALNAHLADKNNPHGVTLAQLGAAAASHTHDASAIVSGILSVLRGGTGASSFTANHPLFGNGSGAVQAKTPLAAMALLGDGYGTCSTAYATKAKVVTLANFKRRTGSRVTVYFTYAVPAGATMNVNNTGAAAIRIRGAAIATNMITAGAFADFVFDGSYWQLVGTTSAPMHIVAGFYTGTGDYGRDKPTTITTGNKPRHVSIVSEVGFALLMNNPASYVFTLAKTGEITPHLQVVNWTDTGVSFYPSSRNLNKQEPERQLNISGQKYSYIAIG